MWIYVIIILLCVCYILKKEAQLSKIKYLKKKEEELNTNYYKETKAYKENVVNNSGAPLEYFIFQTLDQNQHYHKIIANCYLPTNNNHSSEIDLIFITTTGIYVLEAKDYHGYIYGNEQYPTWTQVFSKTKKYPFYNPIWQNKKHVSVLNEILTKNEIKHIQTYSYIVFSNHCTLKKASHNKNECAVMQLKDLNTCLNISILNSPEIYTQDEINSIYQILKKYSCVSQNKKQAHINQIEQEKNNN